MRWLLVLPLLAITGCEEYPKWETDQEKRAALFKECMSLLPAGPVSTHYNDWDEVVTACDNAAFWQSRYCYANCPPTPELKQESSE